LGHSSCLSRLYGEGFCSPSRDNLDLQISLFRQLPVRERGYIESQRALERGKGVVIPGIRNRLLVMLSKVPRPILYRSLKLMVETARKQNKQLGD
jgi:hypothetical protein